MERSRIVVGFVASILLFSSSSSSSSSSSVSSVVSASMSKEIPNPLPAALAGRKGDEAAVYIIYVRWPEGVQPEAFHLDTLAAVLGSKEAARAALVHHYMHVASGFAARLTREQVEALRKQPGVLNVVPSLTYHLQGGAGGVL